MKYVHFLLLTMAWSFGMHAQHPTFPESPLEVTFVTADIKNFWSAFDSIRANGPNPFKKYIEQGTPGLQGFVPNRIKSADSLLKMVNQRKKDYEKNRAIEPLIKLKEKELKPYFYALEFWYPNAVYPPVYFVVGRFNSGGTTSENGLIIGVEMLEDLAGLKELVIHESIHFQQKWPVDGEMNLLEQSIQEGAADFMAELLTGIQGNLSAHSYGTENKEVLCEEFVEVMYQDDYQDWLYGTSGKDRRPNDLGYWVGYEIVNAYYAKKEDKKAAVHDLLNIEDYDAFMRESGYLAAYLK